MPYGIAAAKRLPDRWAHVGHLTREISRVTRFLLLRSGVINVEVIDTKHRRSPLVLG